jgi:hypothetical protein
VFDIIKFSNSVKSSYIDIKIAHGNSVQSLSFNNLRVVNKQIADAEAHFANNGFEIFHNRVFEKLQNIKKPYNTCNAHALIGILCADGRLYACCSTKGILRFSIGSIYDKTSFRDIWYGEKHRRVIDAINSKTCRDIYFGRTSFARYDHYNSIFDILSGNTTDEYEFL